MARLAVFFCGTSCRLYQLVTEFITIPQAAIHPGYLMTSDHLYHLHALHYSPA
jgi:hypothetical protein